MKKYPTTLLAYLIGTVELTSEEINSMTRNEVFDAVLQYEGYGHGFNIRSMVKAIYGIDLDHYEEYLDPESVSEMDGLEEHT